LEYGSSGSIYLIFNHQEREKEKTGNDKEQRRKERGGNRQSNRK